jgi:hypothetical protein
MPFVPHENPLDDHSIKSEKVYNRHELANTNNKKGEGEGALKTEKVKHNCKKRTMSEEI